MLSILHFSQTYFIYFVLFYLLMFSPFPLWSHRTFFCFSFHFLFCLFVSLICFCLCPSVREFVFPCFSWPPLYSCILFIFWLWNIIMSLCHYVLFRQCLAIHFVVWCEPNFFFFFSKYLQSNKYFDFVQCVFDSWSLNNLIIWFVTNL